MKRTEKILAILSVLAIVLNLFLVPGGVLFTLLTLASLSGLYFYFSFALLNGIRLRKIFKKESYQGVSAFRIIGAIGTGFILSMLLVGMMFKLLRWPGASINLIVGCVLSMVIIIICGVRYAMNRSAYCKNLLIRLVILTILALVLLMIPGRSITRFKYRNHPAYLEAFENYQDDPQDEELHRRMEEERRHMEETH